MARGRFINNKISLSQRVHELPIPAQLLYTWMITHLDVEGRMQGEASLVRQLVFPLKPYSTKTVEGWLVLMEKAIDPNTGFGLITRYESNRRKYIWMSGFETEQSNKGGSAWKSREAPSIIPAPPNDIQDKATKAGLIRTGKAKEESRPETPETEDDERLRAVISYYENNVAMVNGKNELELLKDIREVYPAGWFEDAIEIAIEKRAEHKLKYAKAILEGWQKDGRNQNGKPRTPGRAIDMTEEYEVH